MEEKMAYTQKEEFLAKEKEDAISMVKVASFNGVTQNPYPSPFLNLSDTKIPNSSQEIFQWAKYFYMFDPLIAGAINALAAFPITEVYLEDIDSEEDKNSKKDKTKESDTLKEYKMVFHKKIGIHKLLIEIGIDYYLYGNCFVFGTMETNPNTGKVIWKSMVRLDPSKMTIDYNPATQEKKYKWEVPENIARIVRTKKPKEEYDKINDVIKEAVIKGKTIVLKSDNIYHFSRATDSFGDNNVWGTPVVANVLKLLMYRNILRQAQEAIAREHIVPMRIYYINKTDSVDPDTNWSTVASNLAAELQKAVRDPNYKVISPVPVNLLSVGGQGRSLLLTPEIQQIQEEILAGMNVPREFLFGGISYSGSSIALKILENQFITYRVLLKDFMQNFIIKGMAQKRGEWINDESKVITVKMMDLKMQDDVQQKQLIIQLNGQHKCTDEYMWKVLGLDPDKMKKALEDEAIEAVELESKINMLRLEKQLEEMELQEKIQMRQLLMQMKMEEVKNTYLQKQQAQQGIDDSGQSSEFNQEVQQQENTRQAIQDESPQEYQQQEQQEEFSPLDGLSNGEINIVNQLFNLPKLYRDKALSTFPSELRAKFQKAIDMLEANKKQRMKQTIDMRPMPEKLPPRRDSLKS